MDIERIEITIREILPELIKAQDNLIEAIAICGRSEMNEIEVIYIRKKVHEALNKAHQFLIVLSKTLYGPMLSSHSRMKNVAR